MITLLLFLQAEVQEQVISMIFLKYLPLNPTWEQKGLLTSNKMNVYRFIYLLFQNIPKTKKIMLLKIDWKQSWYRSHSRNKTGHQNGQNWCSNKANQQGLLAVYSTLHLHKSSLLNHLLSLKRKEAYQSLIFYITINCCSHPALRVEGT